jgi:predicted transcriptional regulator
LSIKKPYADAIFNGHKRFEFRRSIFRKPVDVVVVYVTNPTGQVAGEFEVCGVLEETVEDLWNQTSSHAGIDREGFFEYFHGCDVGYAIVIGEVRRYQKPLDLAETFGIRPPQSFVYI